MSAMLAADLAEGDGQAMPEEWFHPGDGTTWRLVDGDYYKVSSDADDYKADEDNAVVAALLLQRTLAEHRQGRPTERAKARVDRSATRSQASADSTRTSESTATLSATVVKARKRDAVLRPAEPTPTPPVSATSVAAQHPLLVCKPPLGADSAPCANPANDAVPPDPRRARSGSKPGDVAVDLLSVARPTPDEVEAIAQRLAALLLRGPRGP
jgi:hypothetical protein